jgi:dimethylhistidine N-methyltransferase
VSSVERAHIAVDATGTSLVADVRHFLMQSPRQLPSRGLYDTLGSALFDAICHLPWYPVTRAERRLIQAHRTEILDCAGWPDRLVELGCGNGEKLLLLLGSGRHLTASTVRRIDLVDVSPLALATAARAVSDDRDVVVVTYQQRYEEGAASAAASRLPGERFALLFLGSNIGNFDPPGAHQFLDTLRGTLAPGDCLVIGADLVKSEQELLLAYDDPLGVTAAFNKNLLVRINREMGGTFNIENFAHRAVWNGAESRVEMHLVSRHAQHVDIPMAGLSFDLRAGETIWTESSYKYDPSAFDQMLRRSGFEPARHWIDREGQFLLTVASVGDR